MSDLTQQNLSMRAARFLAKNGFKVSFDNRFVGLSNEGRYPDAIGFRVGASCRVHVVLSRSDFLTQSREGGLGDWRFYLAPAGVISEQDLPPGWGLLQPTDVGVKVVCGWPANESDWVENKPFEVNKQAECDYLYSVFMQLEKSIDLDAVYRIGGEKTQ
jgi:hypothetical protein